MKRCLSCNQFFEDVLTICPTDNSPLEIVRNSSAATGPAPGVPVAKKAEEIGKQPDSRAKPPAQFDLDTQGKETGKFNIKDVAGWDSMIKSVGAAAAKPTRSPADAGNVAQRAASKSGDALKPAKPTADSPAFANFANKDQGQKSPPASPGMGNATAIEASSVKPVEQAAPVASIVPSMPSSAVPITRPPDMIGRIDAEPTFDDARIEQLVNRKAEGRNPSAREIEKVDSIVISGRPRAADAGMTKSAPTSLKFSRSMTPSKRPMPVLSIVSVLLVLILLAAYIAFNVLHH